jgi:type IV pilus assembly protein PilQ
MKGQDKYIALQAKLDTLSAGGIPALNEKVNISVTNVSIQEFIRGMANSAALNINVDPAINIQIVNNFTNVRVADVLVFLCKQYDLSISVIGTILNIYREKKEEIPLPRKQLVAFDAANGLVSIECSNEELGVVARAFVDQTGSNLVPAPGLDRLPVNAYIQRMPIEGALEKFTFANNLKVRKTDDNVFLVEKNDPAPVVSNNNKRNGSTPRRQVNDGAGLEIKRLPGDSVFISADKVSLEEIIIAVADELKADYFFSSAVQGDATFKINAISFPALLDFIFHGTNYSYQKINRIYLIGDNKEHDMKEFRMIQMQNRPVTKIIESVPVELTRDLDIKEFPELNSLLVGGIEGRIQTLESFLKSIDQVVPVILIEVMIIDIKKSYAISTGIEAGLGDKPATTKGKVFPEVDMTFGAQSINNLLNSFNGFGSVKIGKVTPNFYLNLKAMENDGIINIRSTPKLSTLNGHEANMSIGNKEYYLEENSNIYGSLSTQQSITRVYKPVEAKLSVKIKPVVSGDDQITLEIEVIQGDFTDRISTYAPPGEISREFKSLIRVKNQEMVLLGGLEEKRDSNTGSGVPFLARIPIIKWLFSSNSKEDSKTKLNIFIKPTIID